MTWLEPAMDRITQGVASPLMIPGGLVAFGLIYLAAGIDAANFCLSLLTYALLPILTRSTRKGENALHAKIDELIRATDAARNEYIGLDRKTEAEIAQEREQC